MKLSQMNTDDFASRLCRIAAPMERIARDKELAKAMDGIAADLDSCSSLQTGMAAFAALIPALFERHREETYAILSVLTGKRAEEIGRQSADVTLRDVRESLDPELLDFFVSPDALKPEK